ncbi:unnamed protein product, partial [Adineta steineri]
METESVETPPHPPPPTTTTTASSSASASSGTEPKLPVCILVLGMAGAGKTTFLQRINAYLHSEKNPPYVVNL